MPIISTNEAVAIGLRTTRSASDIYGNWTTAEYTHRISFGGTIPAWAVVNSAIVEIYVSGEPATGAYGTASGATFRTTVGAKSINVTVSPGTSYFDLAFSFKGTGKSCTQAVLNISNIALTVSYTIPMSTWSVDKSTAALSGSDTFTVTIVPASTDSQHIVSYAFGTDSRDYTLAAGITSHTFTVPRDWCSQVPNAASGVGGISLSTLDASGNVLGTETRYFTATVPEDVVPTLTGIGFTSIDQKWDLYVQGVSKVTASVVGASGAYGSTITGYTITGGGYSSAEASLTTGLLNTAGDNVFSVYVQDSRGRISETKTATISVAAYAKPSLSSVSLERCLSDGTEDDNGTYLKAVIGYNWTEIGSNSAALNLSYHDSTTETWTALYSGSPDSGASLVLGSGNFDTGSSYQILITISDAIASSSLTRSLDSADVYLDLQPDRLGVGCFAEGSKRFRIADDWTFLVDGKEWTDTVEERIDAKIPEVPVQSVNGQTGDVMLTIPDAPVVRITGSSASSWSMSANSSITLTNYTPSESGTYVIFFNICLATTVASRTFLQFQGRRQSFPANTPYPYVTMTYVGQLTGGTTYPVTFWTDTAGTYSYETVIVQVIKLK